MVGMKGVARRASQAGPQSINSKRLRDRFIAAVKNGAVRSSMPRRAPRPPKTDVHDQFNIGDLDVLGFIVERTILAWHEDHRGRQVASDMHPVVSRFGQQIAMQLAEPLDGAADKADAIWIELYSVVGTAFLDCDAAA